MSRLLLGYAVLLVCGSVSPSICFGAGKVFQLHQAMSEKQLSSLTPAGGAPGFGPPGFGLPQTPTDDAHRNTFGVEIPLGHVDLLEMVVNVAANGMARPLFSDGPLRFLSRNRSNNGL